MTIVPHKTCTRCGQSKPLDEFRSNKKARDGLQSWCRSCEREHHRAYKKRPEIRERDRAYEKTPKARERQRAYQREYTKRPKVREKTRAYFDRPDVNERVKARERQRWQDNEKLREYKRNYLRERYRNNDDHKRKQKQHSMAALHTRRARKAENGGSYSAKEWRELCAKYGHRCLCCGEAKPLTPDHVVPIAKGGSNDISNIQPLCLDCNLRKSTKIVDYRPDQPPWAFG